MVISNSIDTVVVRASLDSRWASKITKLVCFLNESYKSTLMSGSVCHKVRLDSLSQPSTLIAADSVSENSHGKSNSLK